MDNPGHQQGVRCKAPKERRLRRTKGTPQGEATEGNAADDTLMVDQGLETALLMIEKWDNMSNKKRKK